MCFLACRAVSSVTMSPVVKVSWSSNADDQPTTRGKLQIPQIIPDGFDESKEFDGEVFTKQTGTKIPIIN